MNRTVVDDDGVRHRGVLTNHGGIEALCARVDALYAITPNTMYHIINGPPPTRTWATADQNNLPITCLRCLSP